MTVVLLSAVTVLAQLGSPRSGTTTQGGIVSDGFASGVNRVPFSAETVHEIIHTLADGTHITRVSHGNLYRDSESRTRRDLLQNVNGQDCRIVSITDPVQLIFIYFNSCGERIAHVHSLRVSSSPSSVSSPSRSTSSVGTPRPSTSSERSTRPVSPTREGLGTREIEGFTVHGSRITSTIEAGKIGNDQPIVTVTDTWNSSELRQPLLTEIDDPQSGHHTMKLVNILRTEPDPALFQVPADYAVKEE
jgi:hypothetical protein